VSSPSGRLKIAGLPVEATRRRPRGFGNPSRPQEFGQDTPQLANDP